MISGRGFVAASAGADKDTGGITGIPTTAGTSAFTVTARNDRGLPEASATYRLKVFRSTAV